MPISRAPKSKPATKLAGDVTAPAALKPAAKPLAGVKGSGPAPLVLEQRFMYDGAAVASAVQAHVHDVWRHAEHTTPAETVASRTTEPAAAAATGATTASAASTTANAEAPVRETSAAASRDVSSSASASASSSGNAIAFVDTNVSNWQQLVAGISPNIKVVLLNDNESGITQIVDALQGQHDLSAIYIVGHGAQGAAEIGGTVLTTANLASYESELAQIGKSVAAGGSVLLYGCDVAQGQAGETFVTDLSELTHTTVAASSNETGSAQAGGDWTLEYSTGTVTAGPLLTERGEADYLGVLQAPTVQSIILQTPSYSETNADSVTFLVTFSESVKNVTGDAFTFTSDSVSGGTVQLVTAVAGSNGTQYEVTIGNLAKLSGSLTLDVSQTGYRTVTSADGTNTALISNGLLVEGSANDQSFELVHTISTPTVTGLLTSTGAQGDSGVSASDFLTNNSHLQFTGSADAGDTIQVTLDGRVIGQTTVQSNGTWTFDYSGTSIADGSHTLAVTASDKAGNMADSAAQTLIVDTASPAVQSASANGSLVTLSVAEANTLGFALDTGSVPAASSFTVMDNGVAKEVSGVQVSASGTVLIQLKTTVSAGDTVTVGYTSPGASSTIKDAAGNAMTSFNAITVTNTTTNGSGPSISGVGGSTWYNLSGAPSLVFVTSQDAQSAGTATLQTGTTAAESLKIVDGDPNAWLLSATITISSGKQTGDVLSVLGSLPSGITANYANGVLTLTGPATIATYQQVINEVAFSTTSTAQNTARVIGLTVQDSRSLTGSTGGASASGTVTSGMVGLPAATALGSNSVTMNVVGASFGAGNSTTAYLVAGGSLYGVNLVMDTLTPIKSSITSDTLNGMGFNALTGLLYASDNTKHQVVSIDANGTVTLIGPAYGNDANAPSSNFTSNAADVGPDGVLYLFDTSGDKTIYRLDVNPTSQFYLQWLPKITLSQSITTVDIAFNPVNNTIYAVSSTGVLWSISPSATSATWTATSLGAVSNVTLGQNNSASFPMQYFDENGYFYFTSGGGTNGQATLYRVDLSKGPTTATDAQNDHSLTATRLTAQMLTSSGAISTSNLPNSGDAARISTVDLDFGDAPDSYGTTLANNGARDNQLGNQTYFGSTAPTGNQGDGNATALSSGTSSSTGLTTYEYSGTTVSGSNLSEGVVTVVGNSAVTSWTPLEDGMTTYSVTVNVSNTGSTPAVVVGWIDFSGTGKFTLADAASATVAAGTVNGTVTLTWTIPGGETLAAGTTIYARFRVATNAASAAYGVNWAQAATDGKGTGANTLDSRSVGALMDGDVQDYAIQVLAANTAPPTVTFAPITSPRSSDVGTETITFTQTVGSQSLPENVTGVTIGDFTLTKTVDGVTQTISLAGATLTGSGSTYTISGLDALTKSEGTYTLSLNSNATSIVDAQGTAVVVSNPAQSVTFEVVTTAPTIDLAPANASAPDYTAVSASGAAVSLTDVAAGDAGVVTDSSVDGAGQLTQLALTVSGARDGSSETLNFGGTAIAVNASGSQTSLTVGGVTVNVTYASGAFTITSASGGTFTTAQAQSILNAITYSDGANYHGTSDVTAGARTIAVTATNVAGITSTAVETTIDVTATTAAPAPVITSVSDSSLTNGTYLAGTTTPTISGTAEPGSTVNIYVTENGTTVSIGTVTADANGAWSIADSGAPLASDGSSATVTAIATNASGLASASSPVVSVAYDANLPAITSMTNTDSHGSDYNTANTTFVTNDSGNTLEFSGTATANQTVTLALTNSSGGTVTTGTATADATGHWTSSVLVPGSLADGNYTLTASTGQGAQQVQVSQAVKVDSTPPALTAYTPSQSSSGTNVSYGAANTASGVAVSSTLVLTFTEPVSGVAGGTITLSDGTHTQTYTIGGAGVTVSGSTISIVPSSYLDAGASYTVTVAAGAVKDAAGNANAASHVAFATASSTPPLVTDVVANATHLDVAQNGVINAAAAAQGTTVDVSLAGTGATAGQTLYVNWGSQQVAYTLTATDIANGTAAVTIPKTSLTAQGDGTVNVTAHIGTSTQQSNTYAVVVDQTPPGAPTVNSLETNTITPTVTGKATVPAGDVLTVTLNGTTYSTATANSPLTYNASTGTWSLAVPSSAGLAEGDYPVTATVTDAAGNATSRSGDLDIVLTPPKAPTANSLDTNVHTPTLTGTVTIDQGDYLTVTVGGVTYTEGQGALTRVGGNWTLTIPAGNALPDGTYPVTATTHDGAGNVTNGTGTLIIDTTPTSAPTVSITTDANHDGWLNAAEVGSATTAAVKVGLPTNAVAGDVLTLTSNTGATQTHTLTSTDIANGYWNTTETLPANGNALQLSATVTDAAGNVSQAANAAATVDTTAPLAPVLTITTDANQDGYLNAAEVGNASTATVLIDLPAGTVAGDVVTLVSNGTSTQYTVSAQDLTNGYVNATVALPASGSTLGESATITDAAGNVSLAATASAIVDTVAPLTPTIAITTDANQDGYLNAAEVGNASTAAVKIGLPANAAVGDVLTLTSNTGTPTTHTLTSADIANGYWSTTEPLPANGSALQVSVTIADTAGNASQAADATATVDTTVPTAPGVTISTDANGDGYLNAAEVGNATTAAVTVDLPAGAAAGDVLTLTSNTGTVQTVTLSATDIANGYWSTTEPLPANGSALQVSATLTDAAGNVSQPASAAATLDTTAPAAPTVTITTDGNSDGYLNAAEVGNATTATVHIGLPAGTNVGDTVTLDSNGTATQYTVTAQDLTNGYVSATVALPANGSTLDETATVTDAAGNASQAANAAALVDTTVPLAPGITITTDANQDGYLNAAEVGGASTAAVQIDLPAGAAAGDTITLVSNGTATQYTVTAQDLTNGYLSATVALPASGGTLTESATLTDAAGNVSQAASAAAIVDTTAPLAPTIAITTDTNQDGYLNAAEVGNATTATVQVGLPANAVAGDVLTLTSNTGNVQTVALTATDIANGYWTTTEALPAEGSTLQVSATVTDAAGNVSQAADAAATVDTTATAAPAVTIVTDTNQDGYLNAAETGGSPTATVQIDLPAGTNVGDTVTLTSNGTATQYTVSAQDLTNGYVSATVALPATGNTLTETATITDAAGNVSQAASAAAIVDTTAPLAPTIAITTDTNNDGYLNAAEVGNATTATVQVGLPANAVAGDVLTLTSNTGATQTVTLSATDIANGYWTTTEALPAEGSALQVSATVTDAAGNVSQAADAAATVDTTAPLVPALTITTDANQDGYLNAAEVGNGTTATVQIDLPAGTVAGDTITLTSNGTATQYTVSAQDLTNGYLSATVALPATGNTLTESATITDAAGNVSQAASAAAIVDTTAPLAPTIAITTDTNNDGYLNAAEVGNATTATVQVGLPANAVAGDVLTLTSNTGNVQTVALTATDIANGYWTSTEPLPADGSTLQVSATVTDAAGNVSQAADAAATVDMTAPLAPTIAITTDTNQDGWLNAAEVGNATTAAVKVGLPADAVAGDVLTLTSNTGNVQTVALTATDIANGYWTSTEPLPADGSALQVSATVTDAAGNVSQAADAAATVDTTAPLVPTLTITTDANNDGYLNAAEVGNGTTATVQIDLPAGTVEGDTITLTSNGVATQYTVGAQDLTNGYVNATVALPASGATLTETATITDAAGNVSQAANAAAIVDTTAPAAPTIAITTDTNQDGWLNAAEVGNATTAAVKVGLPADAVAGDVLTLTSNTGATQTVALTATDIANGYWTSTEPLPADGSALQVSATVTDAAGNVSQAADAAATVDTTAPLVPTLTITTDANNDGYLNAAEVGDASTATVQIDLPAGTVEGDTITLTSNGVATQYTVGAQDLTNGYVNATVALPASGATLTETATITDAAGNVSQAANAAAIVDTTVPGAPSVTITTDANRDGYLNAAEVGDSTTATVQIGLPAGTVAGDTITLESNGVSTQYTVGAQDLANGYVSATVALPSSGETLSETATVTDAAGNVSQAGAASAAVDTVVPGAPTVTVTTDANHDGYLNATEVGSSSTATVQIGLPAGTVAGDTITLTSNGVSTQYTVGAQDLANGYLNASVTLPASGATLTETASITDAAGNKSADSGAATVIVDTAAPAAPTVTPLLTTDTQPTLSGTFDAADAAGGFSVTVNGHTYTLGSNDPALTVNGNAWSLNLATAGLTLPSGSSWTVTVAVTDEAGNTSEGSGTVQIGAVPTLTQQRVADTTASSPWVAGRPTASAVNLTTASTSSAVDSDLPTLAVGWSPAKIEIPEYVADTRLYDVYTPKDEGAIQIPVIPALDARLIVFHGVPDQDFDSGTVVRFRLPGDAFASTTPDAAVRIWAERSDGGPLPAWLHFNPTTGEFTGKAPLDAPPEVVVHVIARDNHGHKAETTFRIKIHGDERAVKGRQSLSEKLRQSHAAPARQAVPVNPRVSGHA
ncbi:Ig-like domain-containing protein [Paraburkholderia acidisoli]|uniref:DUF4347 domain-containing protein n=1 Tax=Paraburkholderia acidisoli TaxID=2571748 RepID=A0A7Z2GPI6_9BURK|nr:Ig-like domain-containing protein [Paraburkholderia acidisoli]QGZ65508.1 DUF4347 domain-containing protein [Paraburkholderia acidisoli]